MTTAHLNQIATVVPSHDMHRPFVTFARTLLPDAHARNVFDRMVIKSQIEHRFSVLPPGENPEAGAVDGLRVYSRGQFPTTGNRMQMFERYAPGLAVAAVDKLGLGDDARRISHVIVTSCTGMVAPGVEFDLVERCGLDPSVERTVIGFMGCYAAMNALQLSRHIVRSEPDARVLIVNIELCSLHLQETSDMDQMLSFLLFGDGCAASVVSAEPSGLAMDRFSTVVVPGTRDLITWKVRDQGFDMFLSGRVPTAIARGLESVGGMVLGGALPSDIDLWAVHPGGRSVIDAVEHGLGLPKDALAESRRILRAYGNMSSATVMFVLERLLAARPANAPEQRGCAMSFGPGLTAESMLFRRLC